MNPPSRPIDSGRTDALGRRIKITDSQTSARADAPPPPTRPAVTETIHATQAAALAAALTNIGPGQPAPDTDRGFIDSLDTDSYQQWDWYVNNYGHETANNDPASATQFRALFNHPNLPHHDHTLYRGINLHVDDAADLDDIEHQLDSLDLESGALDHNGFISATTDTTTASRFAGFDNNPDWASNCAVLLRIQPDQTTPVMPGNRREHERILAPGTRLAVTSIEYHRSENEPCMYAIATCQPV